MKLKVHWIKMVMQLSISLQLVYCKVILRITLTLLYEPEHNSSNYKTSITFLCKGLRPIIIIFLELKYLYIPLTNQLIN